MLKQNITLSVVNLDTKYTLINEKVALVWTVNKCDCCLVSKPTFVPVVGGTIGEVHDPTEKFAKVKEIGLAGPVFDEVIILLCLLEEGALVVKIGIHIHSDSHAILLQFLDFLV